MQAVLNPKEESEADPVGEYAPLFGHWVDANGQRAARLDGVIVLQLDQLTAGEAQDSSAAEEDQAGGDQEAQRQRLEFARQLLGGVRETLDQTGSHVDALNADVTDEDVLARLRDSVDTGVDQIEALRRLFFSIVEHLKETARRQAELGDETRDASTLEEEEQQKAAIAPLAVRQRGLSSISRQIADSLSKQAEQPPPGGLDAKATGAEPDGGVSDEAQRLGQAAQRVGEAADAMDGAAGGMDGDAKDIRLAQEHQETAFRKLVEALQLLEPPPPPPQQDPNQNQQPPQDQQQQDGLDKQKAAQPQPRQMDMSHLLQAVRDREAQRQRSKRQAGQRGYAPVEKDW
jgi:hypothetical protein